MEIGDDWRKSDLVTNQEFALATEIMLELLSGGVLMKHILLEENMQLSPLIHVMRLQVK